MIILPANEHPHHTDSFAPRKCVASWLRKHGIPSLQIDPDAPSLNILPMFANVPPGKLPALLDLYQNKGVYQGPFLTSDLEALEIKASEHQVRSICIDCAGPVTGSPRPPWDGNELFGYTKERYKYPDKAKGPLPCEQASVPGSITLQSLEAPPAWREVAWITAYEDMDGEIHKDVRLPIAIRQGGLLLLGAPLVDLACHKHMVFASDFCLGIPERLTMSWRNEKWLVHQMAEVALTGGFPFVRINPWPQGKRSAFTIRHDYDRPIPHEQLRELLNFYAEHGFKASFGFKPSLLDTKAIQMVQEAGHEVVLHSEASPCSGGLSREVEKLQAVHGVRLSGMTAHGGIDDVGFIGADQVLAAESENLLYFETSIRDTFLPHQILLHENSSCTESSVLAPGMHFSLDTGTNPATHRADELLASIPAALMEGGHITLMNHPDINRETLLDLFQHLPLVGTWHATHAEVLKHYRSIMYAHSLQDHNGLELVFNDPRDHAVTVHLQMAGQTEKTFVVPAGDSPHTLRITENTPAKNSPAAGKTPSTTVGCFSLTAHMARDLVQHLPTLHKDTDHADIRIFSESMLESVVPSPGHDGSSLYYINEQPQFDTIISTLPLFRGTWANAYVAWLARLLKPGGSIFLQFDPEKEKRGFLSRHTVEDIYGQQGTDTGQEGFTQFTPKGPVQDRPSVLHWFMRNKYKTILDDLRHKYAGIQDPRLFEPHYAEFIEGQEQIESFLTKHSGLRSYFGLGKKSVITDIDKELCDILRIYSYYVGGIRYKGAIVAQIIKDLLGNRQQLTTLDIGGGMGLLSAELLLDETLNVSRATVRDLNYFAYIQAGHLYSFYREQLKDRFTFSLGAGETYTSPQKNDVVTLLGSLLYADKAVQPLILQKAWDSLTPGGLLIVHENIKSPTYVRDYTYMFTPEELDGMLGKFGEVQYYFSNALLPTTAEHAKTSTDFRIVQKR